MSQKITMSQVKAQALLAHKPKKILAIQQSIAYAKADSQDHAYLLMILDLIEGAGYNYSRIATYVGASPSTIQKLVTHSGRQPRHSFFKKLLELYVKVFHGPYPTQRVQDYLARRSADVLDQLPPALVKNLLSTVER